MNKIWYNAENRYPFLKVWLAAKTENAPCDEIIEKWIVRRLADLEAGNANRLDFQIYKKQRELEDGHYGKELRTYYFRLSEKQQAVFAWHLVLQEAAGESLTLYGRALVAVLGDGVLYRNREKPSELLLYMGKVQTTEDAETIDLMNQAFLPFGYRVRVFWEKSFGVLGEAHCSSLNQVLLY